MRSLGHRNERARWRAQVGDPVARRFDHPSGARIRSPNAGCQPCRLTVMAQRRFVVGTESPAIQDEGVMRPPTDGVWHAVDAERREVSCGSTVAVVFDDIEWEARRTAVLCQRCLRAMAGWS